MPAPPRIDSPLTATHKAAVQKGQYLHNQAIAALDRMDRIGLDTTAHRERAAQGLALSESLMREYFPE